MVIKSKKKKKSKKPKRTLSATPTEMTHDISDALFMFFGPPGICKTTMVDELGKCGGGKGTFFFSFDEGTRYMNVCREECISWADVEEVMELLEAKDAPQYDIVCIDHADEWAYFAEKDVIDTWNKEKGTDEKSLGDTYAHGKSWDLYSKKLRNMFDRLRRLKSTIIFICHEEEKEVPINGIKLMRTQPKLDKRTWGLLMPKMHICGRLFWKPLKKNGKRVDVRALQTEQLSGDLYTKDRTNRQLPEKGWQKVNNKSDIEKFITSFEKGKVNGKKENEEEGSKKRKEKKLKKSRRQKG